MNRFLQTARRPGALRASVLVLAIAIGGLSGCGDSVSGPDESMLPTVSPGGVLPTGSTVRVTMSGAYMLEANAASLRTRCFGMVTVTFTLPGGVEENNTCESPDGSANQTNDVTGVTGVEYTLAPGAFGNVTVE